MLRQLDLLVAGGEEAVFAEESLVAAMAEIAADWGCTRRDGVSKFATSPDCTPASRDRYSATRAALRAARTQVSDLLFQWSCRESNPGPTAFPQGFSGAVRYASTRISWSRKQARMTIPVAVNVPISPATELIGGSL